MKYVAHELGGAHQDFSRDTNSAEGGAFIAFDHVMEDVTEPAGKKAVFYELLCIGQAVVRSDNAKTFIEQAQKRLAGK